MPNYPYGEIGTTIDREFVQGINKNFDEVEQDLRGVIEPLDAILDEAFDNAVLISNFEERALEKLEEIQPQFYEFQQETGGKLALHTKELGLSPDRFEGSDIEKMQAAYDYANTNNIKEIRLNRRYDLTGGSVFLDPGYFTGARIKYVGGELVKFDNGFMFDRVPVDDGSYSNFNAQNLSHNAPEFYRVSFLGNVLAKTCVINASRSIRQTADQCKFKLIYLLESDTYTQSVRVKDVETEYATDTFIKAPQHLDLVIDGIRGEASNHSLIEAISSVPGAYAITVGRIKNLLVEGYTQKAPIRISSALGLDIESIYSEANKVTVEIVETTGVKSIKGKIMNNTFLGGLGLCDVLIPTNIEIGSLQFEGNASNIYEAGVEKYMVSKGNELFKNNHHIGGGKVYPSNLYSGIRPTKTATNIVQYSARNQNPTDQTGFIIEAFPFTDTTGFTMLNAAGSSFLVNISAEFGGSTSYRGNYIGLINLTSVYDTASSSIKVRLEVVHFSKTGIDGVTTGNQGADTDIQISFAATGNKLIDPNLTAYQKIYIIIPKFNYKAATSKISIIPVDRIVQSTNALIPDKSQI